MRTGELLNVTPKMVEVGSLDGPAVLSLGLTKSGKRQGAAESITVSVFDVVRRLYQWKRHSRKPLTPSAGIWRAKFSETLEQLGLQDYDFRPYSLRRGGAAFWFTKHGSFDRLLVQGRWQAPRTARIYINSGLAALTEMNLPQHKLRGFLAIYRRSLDQELPSLERTPSKGSSTGGRGSGRKRVAKKGDFLMMCGWLEEFQEFQGTLGSESDRLGGMISEGYLPLPWALFSPWRGRG